MILTDLVRKFFVAERLAHTTGVVALSGGPDSVALAHLAIQLQHEGFFGRIILAHVNHLLRGDESDADEAFVKQMAESLPPSHCRTVRIDVAAVARERGDNLEKTARELRYAWLADVVREENADWLATGHTADDQAETVIHRLLRGTGLQGLTAIAPRRQPIAVAPGWSIVRPLLNVRRADILAYLDEQHLPFRVDSSNLEPVFTRNRIRMHLLPILNEYQPAIVDILGRLAHQARAIQVEITTMATKLLNRAELPRAGSMFVFQTEVLKTSSPYLVCEMFRLVWQRESWPMDAMDQRAWQRLAALAQQGDGGQDFPGRIRVRRHGAVVQIERRNI